MIEEHLAIVSTVGKMILEDQFASKGDVTTELLPLGQSEDEGRLESLQKGVRGRQTTLMVDKCTLFNTFMFFNSFSTMSRLAFALLTSMVICSTVAPCLSETTRSEKVS
jgi:hypothetical protein